MVGKEDLLKTLEDLIDKEFENFKWHLKHGSLAGYQAIKASQLQNAERQDTVDLMVQTYQLPEAVEATKKLLKKINRNDLLQRLSDISSGPEESSAPAAVCQPPTSPAPEPAPVPPHEEGATTQRDVQDLLDLK